MPLNRNPFATTCHADVRLNGNNLFTFTGLGHWYHLLSALVASRYTLQRERRWAWLFYLVFTGFGDYKQYKSPSGEGRGGRMNYGGEVR